MDLSELKPFRPDPEEIAPETETVYKKSNPAAVAEGLIAGRKFLVTDRFSTGLSVLSELKKILFENEKGMNFREYRQRRSDYHHASNRLLVPIRNRRIDLYKSPEVGWLSILYPDLEEFCLPLPQVQGLNSSWQWYLKGISYPSLREKIHPWYGTYFPTRKDHLHLFGRWLKKRRAACPLAIDIGTGCGVLAFMLLEHGCERVIASDIHPNSLLSVRKNAERMGVEQNLDLRLSDLFEKIPESADLIVFNPPWLPAEKELTGMERAIYYEPELFARFFDQAPSRMKKGGTLVVLFSNLAEKEGLRESHPVRAELERNNRFIKKELIRRKVKSKSRKTRRRDHREREFVELWELELTREP